MIKGEDGGFFMLETVDELLPKINISRNQKKVFAVSCLMGVLTHLYALTNMLGNDDSVFNYYLGIETVQGALYRANTGRWLAGITELTQSWFKTPVVAGISAIFFIALMAVLLVDLFEIKSLCISLIVAAILETFPSFVGYVSLAPDTGAYPISAFLAIFAVWLLIKRKKFMASVIALWLSLSMFMANISCALVCLAYYGIWMLVCKKSYNMKDILFLAKKSVQMVIFAGVLFWGGSTILIKLLKIPMSDYQGASSAISGTFIFQFGHGILLMLFKTFKLSYSWMEIVPEFRFTVVISYSVIAVSVIYLLYANEIYKNLKKMSMIFALTLFLPLALCPMSLISWEFKYRSQHRMGWAILLAGTMFFTEKAIQIFYEKNREKIKVAKIILCIVIADTIMMGYGFFLFDNISYYSQQYVMERDHTLCTRILTSLDNRKDFDYEKPVYFLNISSTDYSASNSPLVHDWKLYQNVVQDSTTNLVGGNVSFKAYIKHYKGVDLHEPSNAVVTKIKESKLEYSYSGLKDGEFAIIPFDNGKVYVVIVKTINSPSFEFG